MQDAAGAGDPEKRFQMARVIPHHGSDTVPGLQAKLGESCSEAAGAAIKIPIATANNGLVRLSRNNLDARKDFPRALQDGGEREGKIHHGAAHRALVKDQTWRMLARILGQREEPPYWPGQGVGLEESEFNLVANEVEFRDDAADR
jgi:hypothetical protein